MTLITEKSLYGSFSHLNSFNFTHHFDLQIVSPIKDIAALTIPLSGHLRCTNKSGQSICLTSQQNDWKKHEKDTEKV